MKQLISLKPCWVLVLSLWIAVVVCRASSFGVCGPSGVLVIFQSKTNSIQNDNSSLGRRLRLPSRLFSSKDPIQPSGSNNKNSNNSKKKHESRRYKNNIHETIHENTNRLYRQFGNSVNVNVNSLTGKKDDLEKWIDNSLTGKKDDFEKWIDIQVQSKVKNILEVRSKVKDILESKSNEIYSTVEVKESGRKRHHRNNGVVGRFHRRFEDSVNSVMGSTDYEFGDVTRWLDTKARSTLTAQGDSPNIVRNLLGKLRGRSASNQDDKDRYHFGDLTRSAMSSTNQDDKDDKDRYHFGDLTTKLLRFSWSYLLVYVVRLVVKLGLEGQVVTHLPSSILLDILHMCLAQDMRPKIIRVVATELDKRLKIFVMGDANYEFGDVTKRTVCNMTGNDTYQFGDITKTILERSRILKAGSSTSSNESKGTYDRQVQQELDTLEKDVRKSYQFGDLTKRQVCKFTGKSNYDFGDISKTILERFSGFTRRASAR
jgi:hypothetical protein